MRLANAAHEDASWVGQSWPVSEPFGWLPILGPWSTRQAVVANATRT
jgi:hypothetical protein